MEFELRSDLEGAGLNLGDPVELLLAPPLAAAVRPAQIGDVGREIDRLTPIMAGKRRDVFVDDAAEA